MVNGDNKVSLNQDSKLIFRHLTAVRTDSYFDSFHNKSTRWYTLHKLFFSFFSDNQQLCIIIFLAVRLTQFIVFPIAVVIVVIITIDIAVLLFC